MSESDYDQYWRLVDLWKFYLELTIKANLFFVAIASGLLAYLFDAETANFGAVKHALLPLILLSVGLAILTFAGTWQSKELSDAMKSIAKKTKIQRPVHSHLLVMAMILTSALYVCVTSGLLMLYF